LRESRAYIVANAICGADSTTRTWLGVENQLDDELDEITENIIDPVQDPPANVRLRPFAIPEV